ncbi:hypothetical protein KLP28_03320 [Nocardioidaceae bacterium]|nr:hypothetical protein KLP28_03320 [Nocardioidaceae bacterium]
MATGLDDGGDPLDGDYELITPEHFLPGSRLPDADRRMGIDQWTGEAGLISLAASMDRRNPVHLAAAWLLLGVLVLPTVFLMWIVLHG